MINIDELPVRRERFVPCPNKKITKIEEISSVDDVIAWKEKNPEVTGALIETSYESSTCELSWYVDNPDYDKEVERRNAFESLSKKIEEHSLPIAQAQKYFGKKDNLYCYVLERYNVEALFKIIDFANGTDQRLRCIDNLGKEVEHVYISQIGSVFVVGEECNSKWKD